VLSIISGLGSPLSGAEPTEEETMKISKLLFGAAGVLLSIVGCATEPAPASEAPELETSGPIEQTDGYSYNGWHQFPIAWFNYESTAVSVSSHFTREYGDATRGGGFCLVYARTAATCSADSDCLSAAQTQFGASAYGYCFSGTCYDRPGSQAAFCNVNPNRSPGAIAGWQTSTVTYPNHGDPAVLGCMTKTAGPNTGCGGTNAALYMRYVVDATPPPW
jgi:hypothetical protein